MHSASALQSLDEENELVIAAITRLFELVVPFGRRMEDAAGELPVHQVHLLALVAIGLDADVFGAASDALDLAERRMELVVVEIVQRIDGNHEVEMLVGIGQPDRRADLTEWPHALDGVRDPVSRDVDAGDLDPRYAFREIVQQETLARSDVEHAHPGLEAVGSNHRVGDLAPAAVIFVTE